MRILFIGTVKFSEHALEKLIAMGAEVVGVCTLKESAFNADHADLAPIAEQNGIPVLHQLQLDSITSIAWIRKLRPDVIFCFGWSRLIQRSLLSVPPLGVIGFHPAALPANRGRHPIIWALVLGLTQTASTFFFMDEGPDTGDILSQIEVPITPKDDATSLYERITGVALQQIEDFVPRIANGSFTRNPQDHNAANSWRKRSYPDGQIDWRMAAESIHNLVRGLTRPYGGAHFEYAGQQIKVWKTMMENDVPKHFEPGRILANENQRVLIKAGIGGIRLLEFSPQINLSPGAYL